MIKLRPYQTSAIEDIYFNWKSHNRLLLQMPTGAGKTTVFSHITKEFSEKSNLSDKVLLLVHRRELVEQIVERLKKFQIYSGYILAGKEYENNRRVYVGTIQTINRREVKPKQFSLIIIDEAHHVPSNSYQKIIDFYNHDNLKILGVTATPIRLDNKGFSSSFDKLISSWSIKKFTKEGYLCPIRHFVSGIPNLTGIKRQPYTGDYDLEELAARMLEEKVMADLVESYKNHADNKKMIVFSVNRKHSIQVCDRYNKEGYPARYIDCETPTEEREEILKDFKNNRIKILCNVSIFTEGFDCPDVEVVQLARPTKSLSLYFQQVGRAMRPKPNNAEGIILDNANNWAEHGLVSKEISWSLEGAKAEKTGIFTTKEKLKKGETIDLENNSPDEMKGLELIEVSKSLLWENIKDYAYRKLLVYYTLKPKEFIETNSKLLQFKKGGQPPKYFGANRAIIGSDAIPLNQFIGFINDRTLIRRLSIFFAKRLEHLVNSSLDFGLKKTFKFGIEFNYIRGKDIIDHEHTIKTIPFKVIDLNNTNQMLKVKPSKGFTVITYPIKEIEKEIEHSIIKTIYSFSIEKKQVHYSSSNIGIHDNEANNNNTLSEEAIKNSVPIKLSNLLEVRLNINNTIRTLKFDFDNNFPKMEFITQKIAKKIKANIRKCGTSIFEIEFHLNNEQFLINPQTSKFELIKNKIIPYGHEVSFNDLHQKVTKQFKSLSQSK